MYFIVRDETIPMGVLLTISYRELTNNTLIQRNEFIGVLALFIEVENLRSKRAIKYNRKGYMRCLIPYFYISVN